MTRFSGALLRGISRGALPTRPRALHQGTRIVPTAQNSYDRSLLDVGERWMRAGVGRTMSSGGAATQPADESETQPVGVYPTHQAPRVSYTLTYVTSEFHFWYYYLRITEPIDEIADGLQIALAVGSITFRLGGDFNHAQVSFRWIPVLR